MFARLLKTGASSGLALVMLTGILARFGRPPMRNALAMPAAPNEFQV
jgi:hypothetical protein